MPTPRWNIPHGAELLPNGDVIVVGGSGPSSLTPVPASEVWQVATGSWSVVGALEMARYDHVAVLLETGDVLAMGGNSGSSTNTVEMFDFDDSLDTDGDGCRDVREFVGINTNPATGGDRDPTNPWDFYEVNNNQNVDLTDTLLILGHFGHNYNGGAYQDATDDLLDRIVPDLAKPWRTAEGNNGIDLVDALNNLKSFGHNCL